MRSSITLFLGLTFLWGCDLEGPSTENAPSTASDGPMGLAVLRTSGSPATTFLVRDTVVVHFRFTNSTGRQLRFIMSNPPVVLEIHQGKSVVATSTQYFAGLDVEPAPVLENGQSWTLDWRIPDPRLVTQNRLLPGTYQAEAKAAEGWWFLMPVPPPPVQFQVYPMNV